MQVLLLFRTKCDSSIKAALLAHVSFWQKMKRHKEFPMELNILRQKSRNIFIFLAHLRPAGACKDSGQFCQNGLFQIFFSDRVLYFQTQRGVTNKKRDIVTLPSPQLACIGTGLFCQDALFEPFLYCS